VWLHWLIIYSIGSQVKAIHVSPIEKWTEIDIHKRVVSEAEVGDLQNSEKLESDNLTAENCEKEHRITGHGCSQP
jgi:hypothetical protein